jgi:hypothetical protein
MQISGIPNTTSLLTSFTSKAPGYVYYDPRDTNRDGLVSASESMAYSLTHPNWAALTAPRANASRFYAYNQHGAQTRSGEAPGSLWNRYA